MAIYGGLHRLPLDRNQSLVINWLIVNGCVFLKLYRPRLSVEVGLCVELGRPKSRKKEKLVCNLVARGSLASPPCAHALTKWKGAEPIEKKHNFVTKSKQMRISPACVSANCKAHFCSPLEIESVPVDPIYPHCTQKYMYPHDPPRTILFLDPDRTLNALQLRQGRVRCQSSP